MKTVYATVALAAALLTACKNTDGTPEMSSALDPVGREYHKQDMAKAVAEARFKPGDHVTLRNTQVMVFDRNPQRYTATGDVVPASGATVVMPEGLFVKIKFEDGKTGYISESDIIDPTESYGFGFGTDTSMMPAFLSDSALPPPAAVMQNAGEPPAETADAAKKAGALPPAVPEVKTPAPDVQGGLVVPPPAPSGASDELPPPSSKQ